jgi:hypothetical protein
MPYKFKTCQDYLFLISLNIDPQYVPNSFALIIQTVRLEQVIFEQAV